MTKLPSLPSVCAQRTLHELTSQENYGTFFLHEPSISDTAMNLALTEIESETAELLAAQAQARGLSIDAYLKLLLGMPEQRNALAGLSDEEFDALMNEFASSAEGLLPSPPDFSRHDIYFDHD
ncbi:MAG TPA: hypothetical protein VKK81_27620 [Candidatus Binatia bacterium]|nr:hypothetical protein [Candidatus Binatia bacterium]